MAFFGSASGHNTPSGTPFIPPLNTPEGAAPPVIPSPNTGNNQLPAWATAPQNVNTYPVYPNSPYAGTPFIPHMTPAAHTPAGLPGSYFPPSAGAAPAVLPNGLSIDYTGYPQLAPTPYTTGNVNLPGPPANHPWYGNGAPPMTAPPQVPPGTPWGPPRGMYPPFGQGPISAGAYPPFGVGGPVPQPPAGWGMGMGGYTPAAGPDPWGMHPGGGVQPGWGGGGGLPPHGAPMASAPVPSGPLQRSDAHIGDRMDPFMVGRSYGPVLEPFLVHVVGAQIRINPLIQPLPADGSDRAHLKWNMLFPPGNVQRSTDPPHISWMNGRDEPATFPRIKAMRLVSDVYPWMVIIRARDESVGVTCSDVIEQLSHDVNKMTSEDDFKILSPSQQRTLTDAYKHNRSRAYGVPGGQLGQGLKRLDYLRRDTMYGGIEVDPRAVKRICREVLPCTFILKCQHQFPMTAQEIRDHEARQRSASRASNPRSISGGGRNSRSPNITVISPEDDDDDDDD